MFEEAFPIIAEVTRFLLGAGKALWATDGPTLLLLGVVIGFVLAISLGSLRGMRGAKRVQRRSEEESGECGGSVAEYQQACI